MQENRLAKTLLFVMECFTRTHSNNCSVNPLPLSVIIFSLCSTRSVHSYNSSYLCLHACHLCLFTLLFVCLCWERCCAVKHTWESFRVLSWTESILDSTRAATEIHATVSASSKIDLSSCSNFRAVFCAHTFLPVALLAFRLKSTEIAGLGQFSQSS